MNYNNQYYGYVKYDNGLTCGNNSGYRFTPYAITISNEAAENPTISIAASSSLSNGGIQLTPSITGTYRPAYSYATVRNYNENTTQDYYWTASTEATTTRPGISDWSDATLNWDVTTGGDYATVSSDGLVTITANPTGNIVVTLTVTKGDYEGTQTYTLTRAAAAAGTQITTEISQPTINPVSAALYYNEGSQTFTTSATATRSELSVPAHTTLSASGNTYYYYNGNLYASAGDFGTLTITYPEVTISWALSGDAASYLTRTPATGTSTSVTHTSQSPSDLTATLTVTASAAGAASKTATATITAYGPMEAPTISRTGNSISLATASAGATIYYTTDGSTPTADNGTAYAGPFDLVTSPTTVKAIAIRDGHSSTVTDESFSIILAAPTISVSNTGLATITADDGATIHYTTDGSTPTAESAIYSSAVQLTNPQIIKAIAVRTGYTTSDVSMGDYIITGVSGNTVILDDREDHTWTYYSEKPDADYPNALRSPNPRNVKITYRATDNGTPRNTSGNAISGASAVAVSATESANTFVYYKTIEQYAWGLDPNGNGSVGRWLTGEYAYRTIPNPFSKRPATGTGGGKVYYGFAGWKVISGGNYINEYDGSIIPADQLIHFVGLPAGNDGNGEIVLEAVWTEATVTAVNGDVSGNPNNAFTGGTFETNFVVVSGPNRTISEMTRNVTVMGCYPDGTGATGATLGDVTGSSNDLVIENINLGTGGNDFIVSTGWLVVGRGCSGTVRRVLGNNSTNVNFRLESGTYNFIEPMANHYDNDNHSVTADDCYGRLIFGCDYDRSTNDGLTSNDQYDDNSTRRHLRVFNYVTANGTAVTHSNNDLSEWMDITIKSGYYGFSADFSLCNTGTLNADGQDGMGLGIGGNTDAYGGTYVTYDKDNGSITYPYTNWNVVNTIDYRWQKLFSFYCGRTRGGYYGGVNRVLVEGGELSSINGGGYRNTGSGLTITYHFRMKGGWVKGAVYGTASASTTNATTRQVITGGEINGWIAGACNGTDVDGTKTGANSGNTYIYMGGNAECRSHKKDGRYNNAWGYVGGVEGGNIFASGRGIENNTYNYCGSSFDTYTVVADKAKVEQSVYGGGYIGVAKQSHIYITGDCEIGKNVYGGSSTPITTSTEWRTSITDIRMYKGTVKGGVYGGHYQGTGNAGTIHGNVNIAIYGGTIGEGDSGDGVFGGGFGGGTRVSDNVSVTLGACDAESGATVFGDVYGGSALGTVNDATSDKTTVSLYNGTIYGGLYGGGYGPGGVAANVNGAVEVKVFGGSVLCSTSDPEGVAGSGSVFGCNNAGGAPQSTVTVDIYNTDQPASGYALHAVYGGGNKSPYNNTPVVTIHGCSNSIEYVYGGGNATDVRGTDVTIWGGTIGSAFGGGNGAGAGNPGANITANGTNLVIHGGTIGSVFGGSNERGKISSSVNVTISGAREPGEDPCTRTAYTECPMEINEMYSGGNKAELRDMGNNWIAPGNINVSTDCSTKINYLFGGARMADYGGGDITLTVNGGVYRQIFGGNNLDGEISGNVTVNFLGGKVEDIFGGNNMGGTVLGTITVNIDSTENTCTPDFYVENVYGGGNQAPYSHAAGNYPEVNVKNGTVQQDVYGGGLGAGATVTGSPKVTVGVSDTGKKALVLGNVFGGGNAASVSGDTRVNIMYNTYIKGNVYGGGNAAPVSGNTKVVVGE